jgi:hypothetical protein
MVVRLRPECVVQVRSDPVWAFARNAPIGQAGLGQRLRLGKPTARLAGQRGAVGNVASNEGALQGLGKVGPPGRSSGRDGKEAAALEAAVACLGDAWRGHRHMQSWGMARLLRNQATGDGCH